MDDEYDLASDDDKEESGGWMNDRDDDDEDDVDADEPKETMVLNPTSVRERIDAALDVLSDFKSRPDKSQSRADLIATLAKDLSEYYGYIPELAEFLLELFSPAECVEYMDASDRPRPLVIRTNTIKTTRKDLMEALTKRGATLEAVEWSKVAVKVTESSVPIGATPEYLAGYYMLQSAASMNPVMALAPQPGERVLDMSAAPGGKTSYIAQLMKNSGTIIANDLKPQRQKATVANLHRMGVKNAIVCCYDGRKIPKVMKGFDRVLLDAPCSGLGVISRDQSVKLQRTVKDIQRIAHLQKELLCAAVDAVDHSSKTGGIVVYSTCSISCEENEQVVDYILKKRFVRLIETGLEVGKPGLTRYKEKRFPASMALTRRFYPHVHNMDGFYVAKLQKYAHGVRGNEEDKEDEEEEDDMDVDEDEEEKPKTKKEKRQLEKEKAKKEKENNSQQQETKQDTKAKGKEVVSASAPTSAKEAVAPKAAAAKESAKSVATKESAKVAATKESATNAKQKQAAVVKKPEPESDSEEEDDEDDGDDDEDEDDDDDGSEDDEEEEEEVHIPQKPAAKSPAPVSAVKKAETPAKKDTTTPAKPVTETKGPKAKAADTPAKKDTTTPAKPVTETKGPKAKAADTPAKKDTTTPAKPVTETKGPKAKAADTPAKKDTTTPAKPVTETKGPKAKAVNTATKEPASVSLSSKKAELKSATKATPKKRGDALQEEEDDADVLAEVRKLAMKAKKAREQEEAGGDGGDDEDFGDDSENGFQRADDDDDDGDDDDDIVIAKPKKKRRLSLKEIRLLNSAKKSKK